MAWQLLAAAIPSVAKIATTAINKPKQSDYKPQTKYMEKYLANLRGQQSSNAVFEQAMRPALRTIGAQSRQQQQQIGYNVQRSGLAGSGIEAQQRLTASQGTQEALAGATERAASAQNVANQQLGREAMKVSSQIEMERERSAQAYNQAMRQYDTNLKGAFIGGVANVATMGIQNQAALSSARSILGNDQVQSFLDQNYSPQDIQKVSQYHLNKNEKFYSSMDQGLAKTVINDPYADIFLTGMAPGDNELIKTNSAENVDFNNLSNLTSEVTDLNENIQNITTQNPSSTSSEVAQQGSEAVSPTASLSMETITEQKEDKLDEKTQNTQSSKKEYVTGFKTEGFDEAKAKVEKSIDLNPKERLEFKKQWQGLSKDARSVFESVDYSETNTGVGLTGKPEVWDEVLKSYIKIKGDPTGDLNKVNEFSAWARENYQIIKEGMGG